jgi:glutamate N-acetyltransferase/amino-acid N-acetyltransferase
LYDEALLAERPGRLRGVVMNSQNANACTGDSGLAATAAVAEAAEAAVGLPPRSVLALSTGVIGVPLPVEKVTKGVKGAVQAMTARGGIEAARAIMTTDNRLKHFAVRLEAPSGTVTVGGIAKGAGMIHPNLATALAVITTDASAEAAHLRALLKRVTDRTFHAITVDGDTSPNDSVLMLANGASEVAIARDAQGWKLFEQAVELVARELALMIVKDGEGATRFVELTVTGAATESAARAIGRAIARASLVKTALAGGDPNWGRILAAAGASGFPIDPEQLTLSAQIRRDEGGPAGDWLVLADRGTTANPDSEAAQRIFGSTALALKLDLGMGGAEGTVWTCDLSQEYVRINSNSQS